MPLSEHSPGNGRREIRFDSDPTTATKEYVRDAMETLRTLIDAQAEAVRLLAANQAKEPQASQVAADVVHLERLMVSKFFDREKFLLDKFAAQDRFFNTVAEDFEKLVAKQNELNDKALKAAFDASSQVVQTAQVFNDRASTKAEASSDARMQEMTGRLTLVSEGLTDKIQALDIRITELKTLRTESMEHRSDSRVNIGNIAAWIVAAVAVAAFILQNHH